MLPDCSFQPLEELKSTVGLDNCLAIFTGTLQPLLLHRGANFLQALDQCLARLGHHNTVILHDLDFGSSFSLAGFLAPLLGFRGLGLDRLLHGLRKPLESTGVNDHHVFRQPQLRMVEVTQLIPGPGIGAG